METYLRIRRDLLWLLLVVGLVVIAADLFKLGFDSTDGHKRSGLGLYTDNMTGCQYLSVGGSGIFPRVDGNGRHICTGAEP